MFINNKAESNKSDKVYGLWEVLEKFGRYQIMQYIYICLPTLFITMGNINYVFVVGDVDYRCRIPQCDGPNTSLQVAWWPNRTIDRCQKPKLINSSQLPETCSAADFDEEAEDCHEWVYESSDSAVSELDLACKSWRMNSVGTIHNLGMLIAMVSTGWITDKFGRKYTMVFFMVANSVGAFKMLTTNYYVYIVIEFMESLLGGGSYPAATVLMIEMTGRKQRLLAGVMFAYSIYMGETMFAAIAMIVPNWKILVLIIYVPTILCISLIYLLEESPRWLILNGKSEAALKNLQFIAKSNKTKINVNDLAGVDAAKLKEIFKIVNYEKKENLMDVFRSKEMLKRLFVASFCRFTSNFVYYGIMVNSVWLPGDKYVNFLLSTLMSFPGELIALYLMNKFGRKIPLVAGFIVGGGLCAISAFIPLSIIWGKIFLLLSGKMVMSACFTGAITYCLELFPTSARGSLLGLCAFTARLGGMLAPLTPILNDVSDILPAISFGAFSIITGLLLTLTPETKHMPLMDTIEQVEASVGNTTEKNNQVGNVETEVIKM